MKISSALEDILTLYKINHTICVSVETRFAYIGEMEESIQSDLDLMRKIYFPNIGLKSEWINGFTSDSDLSRHRRGQDNWW